MNVFGKLLMMFACSCFITFLPSCGEKKEKHQGLVIINVLDENLYQDCHIKGSINIPFESIENCVQTIDKDAEIVVYCTNFMCSTSDYACAKLQELGFKHVQIYEGGTAEWYQKGLPVEGPSTCTYLSKHIEKVSDKTHDEQLSISAENLAKKMGLK